MAEIPDDTVSYILKYSDDYNDIDELRTRLMELQKEDNNILEKILKTIRKAEEQQPEKQPNRRSWRRLLPSAPILDLARKQHWFRGGKRRKTTRRRTTRRKTKGKKTKRRKTKGRKTKGRKTSR